MPSRLDLRTLVDRIAERRRGSDKALVISFFGDSVLPHGGEIWLGSLVRLLGLLGVPERGVRTAAFRLVREGWLKTHLVGRRSYYMLTEQARIRFEAAHRSIYTVEAKPWDGSWTMILTGLAPVEVREALTPDLVWQGFGQLLPGVMVHPAPDAHAVEALLRGPDGTPLVPALHASTERWAAESTARNTIREAWNLEDLAVQYTAFLANFRPTLPPALGGRADPESCFRLRTLMIHEYRRVLLRDPRLPVELLPQDWPGTAAQALCRELYRAIHAGASEFLLGIAQTEHGAMAAADRRYFARFGGLG